MADIFINTDGGARGNPGPAAIGVVFYDEKGEEIYCCRSKIGNATNNQAEYQAIIRALEIIQKSKWLKESDRSSKIFCRLDSQLVVEQVNGNYRVKNGEIKIYIEKIRKLLTEIGRDIEFKHVNRAENKKADKLVNLALDEK